MAKSMMISNEVYNKLKARKGDRSFSEVIDDLLENKPKTLGDLLPYAGTLSKKDADKLERELKKGWDKWNKRYV